MKPLSVLEVMKEIRDLLLLNKEVYTLDEFCSFSGYEKSYAYKLVSKRKIPHYKPPGGKSLFFKKEDVISYLTAVRIDSNTEVDRDIETRLKRFSTKK
jgi:excisionase family DNA binding protein